MESRSIPSHVSERQWSLVGLRGESGSGGRSLSVAGRHRVDSGIVGIISCRAVRRQRQRSYSLH